MNNEQNHSEEQDYTKQSQTRSHQTPSGGDEQNRSTGNAESAQQTYAAKESPPEEQAVTGEAEDSSPAGLDYDGLAVELDRLREENAQLRDTVLRKAAEFDNYKKRTQKEKLHVHDEARAEAVSAFLHLREDLKRSLESATAAKADKGLVDGLTMILQSFDRVLETYGLSAIEQTGVPFNVGEHDAMLIQPAPDASVESNTVLQVLEPGYRMGDRVIRHAKVIVSQ